MRRAPVRSTFAVLAALFCACPSAPSVDAGSGGGAATGGGSSAGGGAEAAGGGNIDSGTAAGGGSPNDSGVETPDAGDALSTWCTRYAAAFCAREARCGNTGSAACSAWRRDDCERTVLRRARAGALSFDAGAGAACLARLATARCGLVNTDCVTGTFAPAARLGERCESGDCVEGFCSGTTRWTEGACPVCTAFTADGDLCVTGGATFPCGPASYCDYVNDGGAELCRPKKPDGAPCSSPSECLSTCTSFSNGGRCGYVSLGAPCSDSSQCTPGTRCFGMRESPSGATTASGTCLATLPLNAPCTEDQLDDLCEDPATCINGRCEVRTEGAAGAPCDNFSQCESDACDRPRHEVDGGPFLRDGACLALLAAGAACSPGDSPRCANGLYCGADGGCASPRPAGAPCEGGDCGALACISTNAGRRCVLAPALGEPCPEGVCVSGVCLANDGGVPRCALLPDGAACMGPPRCDSFRCDRATPGAPVCAPSCFPP